MNDVLTYKGFTGSIHFSAEDHIFFGKVEGIDDLVTFEGETVKDLVNAFHYMIDEHIKDCGQSLHISGEIYAG
jgi:predicted HicB family RNase H-like nuclease